MPGRLPGPLARAITGRLTVLTFGVLAVLAGLALGPAPAAHAATITVTSTADTVPPVNTDGCAFREAILAANSNTPQNECGAGAGLPTVDVIEFDISGTGVKTINVTSTLPTITQAVTIDGFTQGVASPNTNPISAGSNAVLLIELNGTSVTSGSAGLTLAAADISVKGLVINRFVGTGIFVQGTGRQDRGQLHRDERRGDRRPRKRSWHPRHFAGCGDRWDDYWRP